MDINLGHASITDKKISLFPRAVREILNFLSVYRLLGHPVYRHAPNPGTDRESRVRCTRVRCTRVRYYPDSVPSEFDPTRVRSTRVRSTRVRSTRVHMFIGMRKSEQEIFNQDSQYRVVLNSGSTEAGYDRSRVVPKPGMTESEYDRTREVRARCMPIHIRTFY